MFVYWMRLNSIQNERRRSDKLLLDELTSSQQWPDLNISSIRLWEWYIWRKITWVPDFVHCWSENNTEFRNVGCVSVVRWKGTGFTQSAGSGTKSFSESVVGAAEYVPPVTCRLQTELDLISETLCCFWNGRSWVKSRNKSFKDMIVQSGEYNNWLQVGRPISTATRGISQPPAPCSFLLRVKRQGSEVDSSFRSRVNVKYFWSYTFMCYASSWHGAELSRLTCRTLSYEASVSCSVLS